MPKRDTPSNSDDIIDSRNIISRITSLESDRDTLSTAVDEAVEALEDARTSHESAGTDFVDREELQDALREAEKELKDWDESDDAAELKVLQALAEECEGYGDWAYGETLIRETHFKEYAQQLAEDIGAIDPKISNSWPYTCIDWEQAASELQQDYTSVDFDGVTYYMRA